MYAGGFEGRAAAIESGAMRPTGELVDDAGALLAETRVSPGRDRGTDLGLGPGSDPGWAVAAHRSGLHALARGGGAPGVMLG